jgi:hypothetical protein
MHEGVALQVVHEEVAVVAVVERGQAAQGLVAGGLVVLPESYSGRRLLTASST